VGRSKTLQENNVKVVKLTLQDFGVAIKLAVNVHNLEQGCLKSNGPCKAIIRVATLKEEFGMLCIILTISTIIQNVFQCFEESKL